MPLFDHGSLKKIICLHVLTFWLSCFHVLTYEKMWFNKVLHALKSFWGYHFRDNLDDSKWFQLIHKNIGTSWLMDGAKIQRILWVKYIMVMSYDNVQILNYIKENNQAKNLAFLCLMTNVSFSYQIFNVNLPKDLSATYY